MKINKQTYRVGVYAEYLVRLLLAGMGLALLMLWPARAQAQTFVTTQPDCIVFFHFTAAAQTSPTSPHNGLDNRTLGCNTWNLSYVNSGFSAVSVVLQSASNSAGSPGTYGTGFPVQQTVLAGANPASNTTGGFLWVVGFNAWVRVRLATVTGSGVVDGALYGWRIPSAGTSSAATQNVDIVAPLGQTTMAASIPVVVASNQTNQPTNVAQVGGTNALNGGTAGSLGTGGLAAEGATPSGNPLPQGQRDGGGNMIIPDYCTLKATFTTSGSGSTQLVAVSSSTTIRVCHIDWSGDTQTVAKLVTGTGATCTSPADETGVFTGAGGGTFGFAMDYATGPLKTTAAKTLCLNLTVGSTGGGTIIYSQR